MKRRNRADEIFNDILETIKEKQKDIEGAVNEYTSKTTQLNTDVVEDNGQITVITDLPGVKRNNIKIDITEDTLEITAEFNKDSEVKNFFRKERTYGITNRKISLPKKIKINETSANFENGVLTIVLPILINQETFKVKVE
jgi:HSP20 family protein